MADLVDAMGVPLAEHHKWLPSRAADFPRPGKTKDGDAAIDWKQDAVRNSLKRCWWCVEKPEYPNVLEVHHVARHDAPFAFALLCSRCHRTGGEAVKASSLHRLLTLKHQYDLEHTSWVHLAIGLGRFLPVDPGCQICGDELVGDECEVCAACSGGER